MRKILTNISILAIMLAFACGSSQEEASIDKNASSQAASGSIQWVKFDDGFNLASSESKHLIAYFWRDG